MPTIELKPASCEHCGSGKRAINIRQFRKDFTVVTESALNIWDGRTKCWVCKKMPVVGETWGISINVGEKNRLYCPECSADIEQKMAAVELGVAETLRTTGNNAAETLPDGEITPPCSECVDADFGCSALREASGICKNFVPA